MPAPSLAPATPWGVACHAVIESDWPREEPRRDHDADPYEDGPTDDELSDPADDCFLPDDFDEAYPEPGDFWLEDADWDDAA